MKSHRAWMFLLLTALLALPFGGVNAASGQATMTLISSQPGPVLVGGEITFDLMLAVQGVTPGVAGAEVYLTYDPALVAPPVSPGQTAAEVLPDFFGVSNFSVNEALPAAKCPGAAAPCIHLVLAGPAQTAQTGIMARFHFRALAIGSASFAIVQPGLVDADGYAVTLSAAPQPWVRLIEGRTVTGSILRQGVPANPNSGGGTLGCVSISASGTWPYGPVFTASDGSFSFPNLPDGTYTLRARYPGYVDAVKNGFGISSNALNLSAGTSTLKGGDVNGDNVVNILDIGSIISRFGASGVAVRSASTSCGADEAADINDDGLVNISDLAIAAGNWTLVGPTPWQ